MNMLRTIAGLSILVLSLALAGCNKSSTSNSPVLAKVNQSSITEADFKRQLGDLAPQMQQAVVADPKARKEFLDDLIGIELVIQEAKKQGLDKDPEFKKSMENHKRESEEYKKKIENQLQDAAKNELFNSLLKKELGDKLNKVAAPTDQEVKDYYEKNKAQIRTSTGKQLALKEVEPQLKQRLMQEKRRELYLAFANSLKAKAKIAVDDKALDATIAALTRPADLSTMQVTTIPTPSK